jgi:hypothetical protein
MDSAPRALRHFIIPDVTQILPWNGGAGHIRCSPETQNKQSSEVHPRFCVRVRDESGITGPGGAALPRLFGL